MDNIRIDNELNQIFIELFDIDIKKLSKQDKSEKLLGKHFDFKPRDLVYLFLEIENKFKIKIKEQYIINGDFQSIEDIEKIIALSLN